MKTTDVFFKGSNFVGREIENVQDLVKAVEAGMDIADCDGNGYTSGYEDEDGCWHEKTKEELFNEMKLDLDNKCELYAGFFLDSGMYRIKPAAATTLLSDFYVGQEVYTMDGNKIRKATIEFLSLNNRSMLDKDFIKDAYLGETAKNLYYTIGFMFEKSMPSYPDYDKLKAIKKAVEKELNENYVIIKLSDERYDSARKRTFMEIFATKEELVKHLMEE